MSGLTPQALQALANRKVNAEFLSGLELLQHRIYPLPGATVPRKRLMDGVDARVGPKPMLIGGQSLGPKDSDLITLYEHVATIKHASTRQIFVAFRQTMDALLLEQQDPVRFPKWLMENEVKRTELKVRIYRMTQHPKGLNTELGSTEEWWFRWLEPVPAPDQEETLAYYLIQKMIVIPENVKEYFE